MSKCKHCLYFTTDSQCSNKPKFIKSICFCDAASNRLSAEIFFFFCRDKKDKKIYTVTDQIEPLIEPHICSLIEREKYWKNNIFKEYLKIDFTPQDDILQLIEKNFSSNNRLDAASQKQILFINLGLLLHCESVVKYRQCLHLLTKDFILCKVFIKSTKNGN